MFGLFNFILFECFSQSLDALSYYEQLFLAKINIIKSR